MILIDHLLAGLPLYLHPHLIQPLHGSVVPSRRGSKQSAQSRGVDGGQGKYLGL